MVLSVFALRFIYLYAGGEFVIVQVSVQVYRTELSKNNVNLE